MTARHDGIKEKQHIHRLALGMELLHISNAMMPPSRVTPEAEGAARQEVEQFPRVSCGQLLDARLLNSGVRGQWRLHGVERLVRTQIPRQLAIRRARWDPGRA